jgi:hypothetical protein
MCRRFDRVLIVTDNVHRVGEGRDLAVTFQGGWSSALGLAEYAKLYVVEQVMAHKPDNT